MKIMKKKIQISHSRGNENTRGVVRGLYEKQMLQSYVVSVAVFANDKCYSLLRKNLFNIFLRRELPVYLKKYTVQFPYKELICQLVCRLKSWSFVNFLWKYYSFDKVSEYIDECASKHLKQNSKKIDAVYCFENEAVRTFEMAKVLGKKCIYDLPIGYWRLLHELLGKEKEIHPEWSITIDALSDSEEKILNKEKEIQLADVIFVASSFTKESLSLYPGQLPPIIVVPYGFPSVNDNRTYSLDEKRKIKLLYVGGLTQRKGLSYMFEALEGLEADYELTIVGGGDIDSCLALKNALDKHRYLATKSHDEVLKLMSESDIFIFPSLFEGFGLVITEAMSQGTPVITTDRTCAPDIITDGEDGWIVDAASADSIKNLLLKLRNDRQKIVSVGKSARETARNRPWLVYQEEMADKITELFSTKTKH